MKAKMEIQLYKFQEPRLKFAYGQMAHDPRDGLTLFGPFDKGKVDNFSVGIVGTTEGIRRTKDWLQRISKPVYHTSPDIAKPFFPGFEEAFHVQMNMNAIPVIHIDSELLSTLYRYDDNHVRVSEIVNLYVEPLIEYLKEGERIPKLWFITIPDMVYALCRPKSTVPKSDAIPVGIKDIYSRKNAGLFEDEIIKKWREAYYYENHFHNQLKIKLLKHKILTQVIKEGTIAYQEYTNLSDKKKAQKREFETAIAWNLATSIYYKIGGLPWKLGDIRSGVCYVGLTFKQDETNSDTRYACCAAQMFLDSGDGIVFRGRVGPYYNPNTKEYHLTKESAKELVSKAIESFKKENQSNLPDEIFIHGKTYFNDEEWDGFMDAVQGKIKLNGIRIRNEKIFKLFRSQNYPVLRGIAFIQHSRSAFLWTKGFIPRIQSVLGLETPNPLSIQIVRGNANISDVCKDIMALTKLNYNSCIFCDGNPVTLKFADTIGEILTAGPNENLEILPFMYYI
jgi:hypothetical protein